MARTKNRWLGIVLSVLMLALFALTAAACGDKTKSFTVTFLDGTTVIATETVKSGEKVAEFKPKDKDYSKEGYTFNGWFATANFSHDWSFNTAIDKDTNVYSQWVSSVQDTRQWTIAGESSAGGPLKDIGWNGGTKTENLLQKTEGKNEFKITIDLYAGDAFQICVQNADGVWQSNEDGKIIARGGQFLEANEYMASASGGLGDGQSNIVVSVSGNYTLTVTTDAVDDNVGKITVVRNGDAPAIVVDRSSYSWYIYGTSAQENTTSILGGMNWGGGYGEAGLTNARPYTMKKTSNNDPDGTGTFVLTGRFEVGDEFLFAVLTVGETRLSAESGTMFYFADIKEFNGLNNNFESKGMGGNISVVTAGYYTFTLTVILNEESNTLEGEIEVEDNVGLLQNGNWIVMGNRLSYAQVTGKNAEGEANVASGQLGLTMTQDEYDAYNSDIGGAKNNFGKGEEQDIKKLTKDEAASTDGVAVYKVTLTLDVGDYFYFAIPSWVYNVSDFGQSYYGTVNAMYNSTVTPGAVTGNLPDGLAAVWTNNFVCLAAGDYSFTVTISANGTLSVAVSIAE